MLTLITGTPGSFKTAYTVWEIARRTPGSTIEAQEPVTSHGKEYRAGDAVPRHLFANINGLLVEHEVLDADTMARWHLWSQPGDLLIYDEVQTLWRPRAVGSKVPEDIQALETHRHRGVDIVVVTQHPMLLDSNVRRLVNRHLHLRRVAGGFTIVYEWDHCGQPGSYKSCIGTTVWRSKREGFKLYKSAQLHTKPTQTVPKVAIVGALALAAMAYVGPMAYGRITERFQGPGSTAAAPSKGQGAQSSPVAVAQASKPASAPAGSVPQPQGTSETPAPSRYVGCIALGPRCDCYDGAGHRAQLELNACLDGIHQLGTAVALDMTAGQGGPTVAQRLASTIASQRATPTP